MSSRSRIGRSELVAVTTRSAQASASASSSRPYADAAEAPGDFLRGLARAVGDGDVPDAAGGDRLERLEPDSPCTDNEHAARRDVAEHALGERERHRARRRGIRTDRGLRSRSAPGGDRSSRQQRQHLPDVIAAVTEGIAHLAEDLGFPQHERVQPRGDATQMPGNVLTRVDVEMLDERRALDSVHLCERVHERIARVLDSVDEVRVQLDAIARREHRMLEHLRAALGAQPERSETLAQLHWSRAVTEPEADEALHEDCPLYSGTERVVAGSNAGAPPVSGYAAAS